MAIKLNGVDYAPDIHLINETTLWTSTAANTLELIDGLTVTIPARCLYVVSAQAMYNSCAGCKAAIAIDLYNGAWVSSYCVAYTDGGDGASGQPTAVACGVTSSSAVTLYFAGAWRYANYSNNMTVRGFYVPTSSLA